MKEDWILLVNSRVLRYLCRYWEIGVEVSEMVDFRGILRFGIKIRKRADF